MVESPSSMDLDVGVRGACEYAGDLHVSLHRSMDSLAAILLMTYIRSGLRSATTSARTGQYELLAVTTKNRSHWAYDGEVTEAKTESGEATVTLTQEALKTGDLHLVLLPVQADDANMHEFLRQCDLPGPDAHGSSARRLVGPFGGFASLACFHARKGCSPCSQTPGGRTTEAAGVGFASGFQSPNSFRWYRLWPERRTGSLSSACRRSTRRTIGRPVEVKPEEPPKAVTTALSADDGVGSKNYAARKRSRIREHRLSRKPARKERYFQ